VLDGGPLGSGIRRDLSRPDRALPRAGGFHRTDHGPDASPHRGAAAARHGPLHRAADGTHLR
jgi:hypothetical protein